MAKVTFRVIDDPNDPIYKEPWTITPIRKHTSDLRADRRIKNAKAYKKNVTKPSNKGGA
jgi:hypothetical protein